jgi:dUTP pyrophosphatase
MEALSDWTATLNLNHKYTDDLRRTPLVMKVRRTHPGARLPEAAYPGDAGFDLYACEDTVVPPGEWRDINVGIEIEPPPGYWVRLVGRSSTFRRRGLAIIEGVVDNGYRGGIYFGVWNPGPSPVTIVQGDRIAQAIIHLVIQMPWIEVEELADSERQGRGFGSTGN